MKMTELKSKLVYKTTDKKWDKLREVWRKKFPKDTGGMNKAIDRAIDHFVKNG